MKIAVTSLRFAPGHMAHLRAYKALFESLGCTVRLFLDAPYKEFWDDDPNVEFIGSIDSILSWGPDTVFSYNIANANIKLAKGCKKKNIKFFYVLHEPWDSFKETLQLRDRVPRRIVANIVNYRTCKSAHKVILASRTGQEKYEKYMHACNKNYVIFPLIFCDEFDESKSIERKYFSFIGGFTENRGSGAFLHFIEYALQQNEDINFVIATRTNLPENLGSEILQNAVKDRRLLIYSGKPMTTEEINMHYRESICVWNAYISTTQSGVLPNALMQGTPVIVSDRGVTVDVITDKVEGCFISIPHNDEEIMTAYKYIRNHINDFVRNSRNCFLEKYEFSSMRDLAKQVYEIE